MCVRYRASPARIRMWVVGLWGACAEREHKTTVILYVRERVYTCQTPVRTKKLLGRVYFSLANREHRWMPSRRYAWRHACRARCVCECAARERASQSKARNDTGARWKSIRSRSVLPQCTACAQKAAEREGDAEKNLRLPRASHSRMAEPYLRVATSFHHSARAILWAGRSVPCTKDVERR